MKTTKKLLILVIAVIFCTSCGMFGLSDSAWTEVFEKRNSMPQNSLEEKFNRKGNPLKKAFFSYGSGIPKRTPIKKHKSIITYSFLFEKDMLVKCPHDLIFKI